MEKNIGTKIRQIRELKGYSQEYMAGKLKVSQNAYSKLETGKSNLNWDRIADIATILEVNPMDIASFDDNLIFHGCTQSGKYEQFNNYFPRELKDQYESRIKELQSEVEFLHKIVLKNNN